MSMRRIYLSNNEAISRSFVVRMPGYAMPPAGEWKMELRRRPIATGAPAFVFSSETGNLRVIAYDAPARKVVLALLAPQQLIADLTDSYVADLVYVEDGLPKNVGQFVFNFRRGVSQVDLTGSPTDYDDLASWEPIEDISGQGDATVLSMVERGLPGPPPWPAPVDWLDYAADIACRRGPPATVVIYQYVAYAFVGEAPYTTGASFEAEKWLAIAVMNPTPVEALNAAQHSADAAQYARDVTLTAKADTIEAREATEDARDVTLTAKAGTLTAQGLAEAARDKAQDWAESAGEPGVAGTNSAKTWSGVAEGHANDAAAAQLGAESARDTAFANANIYTSTALGIAATTNGQQFGVVEGDYIQRYSNNSGVAVIIPDAKYPTAAALQKTALTITETRALTASDGNRLLKVNIPGPIANSINHLRLPTNAADPIPVGTKYKLLRTGGSLVRILAAAGVTLTAPAQADLIGEFSWARLEKDATDAWTLYGDLAAAPAGALTSKIWLDPSDISTLRVERTGASAATEAAVDGPVGSWRNKGTLGGWATAPSDAQRPTLRFSFPRFWLEFDGNVTAGQGDCLILPAPALDLATIEMFLGMQIIDWATGQGGVISFAPASGSDIFSATGMAFYIDSRNYAVVGRGGLSAEMILSAAGIIKDPHVYELRKPNNSSATLHINGALAITDSTITTAFATQGGNLLIGMRYQNGINAPGNFKLFGLIIDNEVTADVTPIRAYMEQKTFGAVPTYPAIANTTELDAARATLISEVFATHGGVIPTDVATLELEGPPVGGLTNLATCHRMIVPGYPARPRLWTPNSPRDDVILFVCAGHDVPLTGNALSSVPLQSALTRGVRVVTFVLPNGPNELTSGDPGEHETAQSPMSEWVGPVSIAINTLAALFPSAAFNITGISGGGWMANICGATDVRIKGTYQFVGTLPDYIYFNRDWEQRLPGLTADYMTLYLLGACPSPRRHKHILYENDPVAFNRAAYSSRPPWDAQLAIQAASIGGGNYDLVWDDYNLHTFRNPFFTTEVLDEIAPLP